MGAKMVDFYWCPGQDSPTAWIKVMAKKDETWDRDKFSNAWQGWGGQGGQWLKWARQWPSGLATIQYVCSRRDYRMTQRRVVILNWRVSHTDIMSPWTIPASQGHYNLLALPSIYNFWLSTDFRFFFFSTACIWWYKSLPQQWYCISNQF